MANWEGDPSPLQGGPGVQEFGQLGHGVLLAAVGVGEVGEHPLRLQAGQAAQPGDLLRRLLPPLRVPEEAQAAHARVQLHMDLQGLPRLLGGLGQPPSRLQVLHHLGDLVLQQQGEARLRGLPQAQDGDAHPAAAQLLRLADTGHRQHVGPQLLQLFADHRRPVAIGVGLAQAQKAAPGGQHGPQGPVVVLQGGQIDLRPGPHLCGIQSVTLPLSCSW